MPSLNDCNFIGHLTRDPAMRQTAAGKSVCDFGLAVNKTYKDEAGNKREKVDFFEFVAWGAIADLCAKYIGKGSLVYIGAESSVEKWEDKKTGEPRQKVRFVVGHIQFLDARKKDVDRPQTRSSMRNPEPEVEDENW